MERRERYDVVIAGGGPAGCAVAARLSENRDRSVCLVEAGPDYGPRGGDRWPGELLDATGIPETHDWRDEAGSLPWARVIGGCSAHNACFITRAPLAQYESWAGFGGAAWSSDKLLSCLQRADRQLGARALNADEIGAWQGGVLDAAVELGLARSDDPDSPEPRVSPARVNTDGTTRFNASFAYLDPCRERPNLDVLGDSVAERVLLDGDRAVGLIARDRSGGETELPAGSVIVCCGSYGSPALLLRSGIGPPDELRRHGIEVRVELPGVGADLADHPRFVLAFALDRSFSRQLDPEGPDRRMVGQVLIIARSGANDEICDLHLFPVIRPLEDGSYEGRISVGGLAPHSRGSVRLASTDPWALPAVDHGFLTDEREHRPRGDAGRDRLGAGLGLDQRAPSQRRGRGGTRPARA